jgi:predicted N-formylglutamate amidohydrolase
VRVVLSCEHGGNRIPAPWRGRFARARAALESHRGWDPGALRLAREMSRALDAPLVCATVSRLLVELNRSRGHPLLFSEFMRDLDAERKEAVLARYYRPYRRNLERLVAQRLRRGAPVVHLSCHSFAPRLNGHPRRADVGLLYDPARATERRFCDSWRKALAAALPELRIRRNYPYRGNADGLTTALRRRFGEREYLGIELEVSQRIVSGPPAAWNALRRALVRTFAATVRAAD